MTNLQKIQQETEEKYKELWQNHGDIGHTFKEIIDFIHSREKIAYEAGYEQGDREHFKSL